MNKEIYKAYLRQRLYESPTPPGPLRDAEEADLPMPGSEAEKEKKEREDKKNRQEKLDDYNETYDTEDNDVYVPKGKIDPRFMKFTLAADLMDMGTDNAKQLGTNEKGIRETDVSYISDKKQKKLDASTDEREVQRNKERKERKARLAERKPGVKYGIEREFASRDAKIKTAIENSAWNPSNWFPKW